MKKILWMLTALVSTSVSAAIYVNQNPSGGIEYTDTPSSSASKMDIPATNSISTPKPAAPSSTAAAPVKSDDNTDNLPASNANTYKTFEMTSPKNGTTFQNQPVIPVEFNVEPNILPGDKIQVMLDDQPAGTPTATVYQEIPNVARGTHSVYAAIINSNGEAIKRTGAVTIYVHRASVAKNSPARVNRISQLLRA